MARWRNVNCTKCGKFVAMYSSKWDLLPRVRHKSCGNKKDQKDQKAK